MPSPKNTHFGFEKIPIAEKSSRVANVFHSVASKYDLMNDLMSFGLHRLWKRFTIDMANARPGQHILDIAGGTGDLAQALAPHVKKNGLIILADINESMLNCGRNRLIDKGITGNIHFVQADAEHLPFPAHYFDCITIAFGLRNVTDKKAALLSMHRVLKPGGKVLILEFSKPHPALLSRLYDQYSFHIIPKLGAFVSQDEESYRYLVESIRMHPDQEALKKMMIDCGFETVDYFNLSGGIVALHKGMKY